MDQPRVLPANQKRRINTLRLIMLALLPLIVPMGEMAEFFKDIGAYPTFPLY